MTKIKWIALLLIALLYLYFIKFPIIIDHCKYEGNSLFTTLKEDKGFKLSDKIKISNSKQYKMILIIRDRYDVPNDFSLDKVFITSDQELIKNFLNTSFRYTNSDVATIESEIFIYENDQCILRSSITLRKEGLQNSDFGWIEPEKKGELNSLIKKFNANYSPVIILK